MFEVDLNNDNEKDDLDDGIMSLKIESTNASNIGADRGGKGSLFDDDVITGNQGEDDLFTTPSNGRKSAFEKKYEFDGDDDEEDLLKYVYFFYFSRNYIIVTITS